MDWSNGFLTASSLSTEGRPTAQPFHPRSTRSGSTASTEMGNSVGHLESNLADGNVRLTGTQGRARPSTGLRPPVPTPPARRSSEPDNRWLPQVPSHCTPALPLADLEEIESAITSRVLKSTRLFVRRQLARCDTQLRRSPSIGTASVLMDVSSSRRTHDTHILGPCNHSCLDALGWGGRRLSIGAVSRELDLNGDGSCGGLSTGGDRGHQGSLRKCTAGDERTVCHRTRADREPRGARLSRWTELQRNGRRGNSDPRTVGTHGSRCMSAEMRGEPAGQASARGPGWFQNFDPGGR